MTNFKTRKKDGQVFPTDRKSSRDSGNPSYVGVDKSQIEKKEKPISEKYPIYALEDPEGNGMTQDEVVALWQHGVDTGIVWRLQGWYGRNAQAMLDAGIIKYPRKHKEQSSTDFYGNKIPTHAEAKKKKLYKDSDIKNKTRVTSFSFEGNKADLTDKELVKFAKSQLAINKQQGLDKNISSSSLNKPEQAKKFLKNIGLIDTDRDGVPDNEDCEPNNPKKQGILHDIQKKIKKYKETKDEERTKEEKEKLKELQKELSKRISTEKVRKAELDLTKQKREELEDIEKEEQKTKQELKKYTFVGRFKASLKEKQEAKRKFLATPEGKEQLRKEALRKEKRIKLLKGIKKVGIKILSDEPERKSKKSTKRKVHKKKRKAKEGLGGLFE